MAKIKMLEERDMAKKAKTAKLSAVEYAKVFEAAFKVKDDLLAWRGSNTDQNTIKVFLTGVHRVIELAYGRPFSCFDVVRELRHSQIEIETVLELWSRWRDIQLQYSRMIELKGVYDHE